MKEITEASFNMISNYLVAHVQTQRHKHKHAHTQTHIHAHIL